MSANKLSVFLCHASQDKEFVRSLYEKLTERNADPWLDEKKLLPGQKWDAEIKKAVKLSDVVVVLLSTNSVSKVGYVQKELKFALDIADEHPDGTMFLIPARIDECTIPARLEELQSPKLYEPGGIDALYSSLAVRATSLKRLPFGIPRRPSKRAQYKPDEVFRELFLSMYWDNYSVRTAKSRNRFGVAIAGVDGVGKTSLAAVLSHGRLTFGDMTKHIVTPYRYKISLGNGIFVIEQFESSHTSRYAYAERSLHSIEQEADLILFVLDHAKSTSPDCSRLFQQVDQLGTPVVVIINKIELLPADQIPELVRLVKDTYGRLPLPISSVGGQGIRQLEQFISHARRFYD